MKKKICFLGIELQISIKRKKKNLSINKLLNVVENAKLNFGPGPNWIKPSSEWINIDVDPDRADIVINFRDFKHLPLRDDSIECVYGSHVFEHISIFKTPIVFKEVFRVLKKNGVFRLVLPDVEKSINEYINSNEDFLLFKRRKDRALLNYKKKYTLFECLKEDFLSPNGQIDLLGKDSLAHQNAWDFQSIKLDLVRAGFDIDKIKRMGFKATQTNHFSFEGAYESEANEDYRSLYIEAIK